MTNKNGPPRLRRYGPSDFNLAATYAPTELQVAGTADSKSLRQFFNANLRIAKNAAKQAWFESLVSWNRKRLSLRLR